MPDEIIEQLRKIKEIEQAEYVIDSNGLVYNFIFRANGDKRYGGGIPIVDGKLDPEQSRLFIIDVKKRINGK